MALGSHLISSIGFEEEVTHTIRERERQIEDHCSLSKEIFEREREQEKTREKPLQKISRTRKKRKGTNFETTGPAEWHKS